MLKCLALWNFVINRKRIRIWGGSLDPLQGWTHCFIPERAERMYEMVLNGHFNTLRIWGEGIPYPDEFYDMADEKGLLIWQEFFMGYGPCSGYSGICGGIQKRSHSFNKTSETSCLSSDVVRRK